MQEFLWLIPFLPLAGFLFISLSGKVIGSKTAVITAVSMTGLSAVFAIVIGITFISAKEIQIFSQELWTWISVPGFNAMFSFRIDSLTVVFIFIVSFVSFLIHLYSAAFMLDDDGIKRFFAYMNLFTASMLILVMADNLLLLYLGWEGVGLCSYLLIGFWYKEPENGYAARKAFIITRIGDTAMAIALFFLYRSFGTLNIHDILTSASSEWFTDSPEAKIAAFLLLAGAAGKSAQIPFQTWLPDAMAGPSPVSALIHAATMVTAGVYLIARMNVIFTLSPLAMSVVALIGIFTLIIAGFSALMQHDIKRVLAYSTISQIGYMFLALGVGAWSAAVFHFFTHAFFKALLFLAAGVVILKTGHEHDMFKMGGLRKKLPVLFYTFLAGAASLSALPLITAGFFSKDLILTEVFAFANGGKILWIAGLAGAGLTALYTFRMVFITFYGELKTEPDTEISPLMTIPLVILAILSIFSGFIEIPGMHKFSAFMHQSLPEFHGTEGLVSELVLQIISGITAIAGLLLAYWLYIRDPESISSLKKNNGLRSLGQFWESGWGFDYMYDKLFVNPYVSLSKINKNDIVDKFYSGLAILIVVIHKLIIKTQNGRLRWYIAFIVSGLLIGLTIIVFI